MSDLNEQLLPCAFCGSEPVLKRIGNDHTKSRAVQVKCSNVQCRIERTDKALTHGLDWLEAVAIKNWNRRASAPAPQAAPSDLLTNERINEMARSMPGASAVKFARAILAAAPEAPVAPLTQAADQSAAPLARQSEHAIFKAARNKAYPVPDSPHTSVNMRAVADRTAFTCGWKAARALLPAQQASESLTEALEFIAKLHDHEASTADMARAMYEASSTARAALAAMGDARKGEPS